MRFKKVLLIPSAMLCFAALAACGKTNQERFVNGFESPELEEYFKVPQNLQVVDKGYGQMFVRKQALLNSILATSNETTIQLAGNSAFYDSYERRISNYDMFTKVTPYSSSSTVIYAKNITKKYDDDYPVATHTEQSYRSMTDSKGNSVKSNENDFTYLCYAKPDGVDSGSIYAITKGKDSLLGDENDLVYKTKINSEIPWNQLNVEFSRGVHDQYFEKDFNRALPYGTSLTNDTVYNTYCDLSSFDVVFVDHLSSFSASTGGLDMDNTNFYYDGKNTIYETLSGVIYQGYVLSPLYPDAAKSETREKLVPAYQTANITLKYILRGNEWYCNSAATNSKVYLTKDEHLNEYTSPRCVCSEYYCSKVGYDSCGKYGNVDDAVKEYASTKYGIGIDVYDGDEDSPYYHDAKQTYRYDALDSNLEHVGGIYDRTMTFKTLGYDVKDDERMFYGTFDISDTETIDIDEDNSINVTMPDIAINLVDRDDLDNPINIFDDADPSAIHVIGSELSYDETNKLIKINKTGATYEFTIKVQLDGTSATSDFYELQEVTVKYYSDMSASGSRFGR